MGVTLTSVGEGDAVVAVTRNPEADEVVDGDEVEEAEASESAAEAAGVAGDEGPASDGDGSQAT